ncbi:Alpha/Beta hydrolase protein [Cercophora newfieldiana]|uniref:Alpha/Beta hydrolase protein n=1 Tax=Cercophora newfieldiana TaxID=92897 RepID=A0AA40CNV2_9PEZI|nr:Alpha/Beta hydrolase protein [Cercophora newfieldiana]
MEKKLQSKVLYDPESRGRGTAAVDVVLVHGLDGDLVETWAHTTTDTKPLRRVVWPETLLPKVLPRARVLSFGYNGDIYHNNSVAGIRGNAGALLSHLRSLRYGVDQARPIVFVAHCLGGLIVKQALCFADVDEHHQLIASATKGIMFFGTPHCGAEEAQWKRLAQRYSRLPGSRGQASLLLEALTRDSNDLAEISEDFCHVAPKYRIVSFFEEVTWLNTGELIVDMTSARLDVYGERVVPVGADHLGICRFADDNDMTFMSVWQEVRDVAPASAEALEIANEGDGGVGEKAELQSSDPVLREMPSVKGSADETGEKGKRSKGRRSRSIRGIFGW